MIQTLRRNVFKLVIWGCGAFILLTVIAMLVYQDGHHFDPTSPGYSFVDNFFSDLGRTEAYSGQPNWASAVLFCLALSMAGGGLVGFFLAFPRFFTRRLSTRWLSLAGSLAGVVAGLCFIGIACTPANLARPWHIQFVMWAFRLFPLAVLFYIPALFLHPTYPRRYGWLFVVFWALLSGYYLLLTNGPSMDTPQGFLIQVVGQKIIAYASVLSIGLQALGAHKVEVQPDESLHI